MLREHRRAGYVDAIPNVMARLFPDSRFAAYPMPFHRAAAVKSLVNGQLDSLRALIFRPEIYTWWERLLVGTGLSTNVLFPTLVLALVLASLGGGVEVLRSPLYLPYISPVSPLYLPGGGVEVRVVSPSP